VYYYQEVAEKTAVETTVLNMRTGLRYKMTELMLHGRVPEISRLAGENPVKWLASAPSGYLGACRGVKLDAISPGSWCFDEERRELLYRINRSSHFVPGPSGEKGLRFRIVGAGKSPSAPVTSQVVEGVKLVLVEEYRWF